MKEVVVVSACRPATGAYGDSAVRDEEKREIPGFGHPLRRRRCVHRCGPGNALSEIQFKNNPPSTGPSIRE